MVMQINYTELVLEIGLFVLLVAWYKILKPAFKQWMDDSLDEKTKEIVTDAVCAAEQTIKDNSAKKEWVLEICKTQLAKIGVDMTLAELDRLIESTVYAVKNLD